MKTLILYLSQDGQTQKIAVQLAQEIGDCELVKLTDFKGNLADYEQIIIGSPVRYGRFKACLYQFIAQHQAQLKQKKTGFFGVNLTARKKEKSTPETNSYVRKMLQKNEKIWQPTHCAVFAGALRYPHYHFMDRQIIRFIMFLTGGVTDTTQEIEYTDWQKVTEFAQKFQ